MLSGEIEREQEIKGVIAHEICHYVMRLVYQNNEKPYYEKKKCAREKMDDVNSEIKLILFPSKREQTEVSGNHDEDVKPIDDECGGIISTVYDLYDKMDWHPELIVRPVQIQVQFDNDKEKFRDLEDVYKILFAYFELFVIPELKKFNLTKRKKVQKFNNAAGVLSKIQELNLKFLELKDLRRLFENQLIIVTTNAPKLFLCYIGECLREKYKELFDVRNIFMTSIVLENSYTYENFKEIINKDQQLNVIVDCSKEFGKIIDLVGCKHKFVFVVSDEDQQEELSKNLCSENRNAVKWTINYDWMDLTAESKKSLLQAKVNFQNNSTFSLMDLIRSHNDHQDQETFFNNIMDNKLLNLLIEKSGIVINQYSEQNISDKYLSIMFQPRDFIKNSEIKESEKSSARQLVTSIIEQDQMIENSKNLKFVLISDKAGSGKSWILKNLKNKLREAFYMYWIDYIDLKQFIREFKAQDTELEFAAFMTEKILKPKTKFEAEIFKKLYKNGKVCILFDGFDEIAPDCAEFVTKLFQSFQQNGGNQLWIATRDYFEIDLKEKLGLNVVFKLHEFTDENGISLIASSWLLDELHDKGENLNEMFGKKHSQKLQKYKIIAKKLNKKIPMSQNDSIGLPQFYKMIANISTDNKDLAINLTTFEISEKYVDSQYERWSKDKGAIRSKANVKSQHMELNFHKLHQLVAMESLFPDESDFCGLRREHLKQWTDEEIIACAMLSKKFGKFLFSHETFREYYAATFILEKLTKWEHFENVCIFLIQFLTIKKFAIIRMYLNDALGDKKISTKIMAIISLIAKNLNNIIHKFEISSDLFEENLPNLADFVIKILTYSCKEKIKNIFLKNQKITLMAANHTNLFIQIQYMILDCFNENELKDFLLKNGTLLSIIVSIPDLETTEDFINGVKSKTEKDPEFIRKALKLNDKEQENILSYLIRSRNVSLDKFKQIFQMIYKFLTVNKIITLVKEVNINECQNVEIVQFMWTELEKIITSAEFLQDINDGQKLSEIVQNIFQTALNCDQIEFHETLWALLLKIFENRVDLKNIIMQKNENKNNYVHLLVMCNKPEIINFKFTKIKEKFNDDQYEQILRSKGNLGRNLLQKAAGSSKDIKTHQILWNIFRDTYKSNKEFMEIINDVDEDNNNVFRIAACFTSKEIFEFMMNELEKIASKKEIINILKTIGFAKRNLLQSAAMLNKSADLHEFLWTKIKKYFSSEEILEMIKHTDEYGNNVSFYAARWNTKEILELTWKEIKNTFDTTRNAKALKYFLSVVNNDQENSLHVLIKSEDSEKLKKFWSQLENFFTNQQLRKFLKEENLANKENILRYAAKCNKIEFQETFWKLLLNAFENREELKKLILQGDKIKNNFVHFLLIHNKPEIIEFTIRKIKENFNDDQYKEILISKGQVGRNLLQVAACFSVDIKMHQILWKIFRDFNKSDEIFLEFLKEVDNQDNNVFHLAAYFTSKEIFEFMINELEKIATKEEI